jgi:hypothetical protein
MPRRTPKGSHKAFSCSVFSSALSGCVSPVVLVAPASGLTPKPRTARHSHLMALARSSCSRLSLQVAAVSRRWRTPAADLRDDRASLPGPRVSRRMVPRRRGRRVVDPGERGDVPVGGERGRGVGIRRTTALTRCATMRPRRPPPLNGCLRLRARRAPPPWQPHNGEKGERCAMSAGVTLALERPALMLPREESAAHGVYSLR